MKSFPKWMYHKELSPGGKIIKSEDDFRGLGKGWVETPADFDKKSDAPKKEKTPDQENDDQEIDPDQESLSQEVAPIQQQDFTKKKVTELRTYLIENGVPEKELFGLKKDELIARIGDI